MRLNGSNQRFIREDGVKITPSVGLILYFWYTSKRSLTFRNYTRFRMFFFSRLMAKRERVTYDLVMFLIVNLEGFSFIFSTVSYRYQYHRYFQNIFDIEKLSSSLKNVIDFFD